MPNATARITTCGAWKMGAHNIMRRTIAGALTMTMQNGLVTTLSGTRRGAFQF